MAAIDGLLALIEMRNASALVLATDQVPALVIAGTMRPLSMPALAPGMLAAFVDEVLDAEQRARVRAQANVEAIYTSQRDGKSFSLSVQSSGEGTVLRFVPSQRATAAPAALPRSTAGLDALLANAFDRGASDIVVPEGRPPRLRFAGHFDAEDGAATTAADIEAFLGSHLTSEKRAVFERTGSVDLAYTLEADRPRRFRANLFRH